jgi:hypothetical protein
MRSIAIVSALAVFAAAPALAQGKFRTGDINPTRRAPTATDGQGQVLGGVLGGVLGSGQTTTQRTRNSDQVPRGHLPPAGMCRIWIDGVPPGHQPAPTDCQTAVATKPANARVIWGDQTAFPGKGKGKFAKQGLDKGKQHKIDRDDDLDDRNDNRGRGKSVAKGGKKG